MLLLTLLVLELCLEIIYFLRDLLKQLQGNLLRLSRLADWLFGRKVVLRVHLYLELN